MNKETKIAKENIKLKKLVEKNIKELQKEVFVLWFSHKYQRQVKFHIEFIERCKTHKSLCERFLEFLDENFVTGVYLDECSYCKDNMDLFSIAMGHIKDKITDLKQAIKLYEDAGI